MVVVHHVKNGKQYKTKLNGYDEYYLPGSSFPHYGRQMEEKAFFKIFRKAQTDTI